MNSRNLSHRLRASPVPVLLLAVSLAACGGRRMSLGDNADDTATSDLCNGGTWTADVSAHLQSQLDELFGCEVIEGDLEIRQSSAGELSLTALSHLRQVRGDLEIVGVSSFAGLEALEQVGNLRLSQLGSTDLTALSQLRRVLWESSGKGSGFIDIRENPNLQSLAGLEGVTVWSDLQLLDNPTLASLVGLSGPPFPGLVNLTKLPALRDVRALDFASTIQTLYISYTGLESLEGLTLGATISINVEHNPALESLNWLGGLRSVDFLRIQGNDSLIEIYLSKLEQARAIQILHNDALNFVPAFPSRGEGGLGFDTEGPNPRFVPLNGQLFEVGGNANLVIIRGPDGFTNVEQISIWGNPSLLDLNLNHLEQADGLQIRDNASLNQLSVPQLRRVGDLEVVNNPALSIADFAGVPTFSRSMSGNADADPNAPGGSVP